MRHNFGTDKHPFQCIWSRGKRQVGSGSVVKQGIELAFDGLAVAAQVSRAMRPRALGVGGLNSAKYSNPRPQDQNLAFLVGTRVPLRGPPSRTNGQNSVISSKSTDIRSVIRLPGST